MGTDVEPVETEQDNDTPAEGGAEDDGQRVQSDDRTPVDRPSRKERREAKKIDFQRELRDRDERFEAQRQQGEQMARELAELRGRLAERERTTQKADPFGDQIAELEKQAKADLKAAAAVAQSNPAEAERLVDEHNKKLRRMAVLEVRREDAERAAKEAAGRPAPLPPQIQNDVYRIAQEHPWLQSHPQARNATDNLIETMVAQGKPANYATFKAAATAIAVSFGLGGQSAPTNGQRQRYTGIAPGEGEGSGGDTSRRSADPQDKHEIALARALANREGKGSTDEEARALWAKKVGARLANRQE